MPGKNRERETRNLNIALDRENCRKTHAIDFIKKIETDKDAMSIFINQMKKNDKFNLNTQRLMQVTSFDKSYLHSVKNEEDLDQDDVPNQQNSFANLKQQNEKYINLNNSNVFESRRTTGTQRSNIRSSNQIQSVQLPNLAYANRSDAFDKVGTLSSRRVQSNDYYYKYLDHYTPGSIRFEKGTKSTAANRSTKYSNFIPFEQIAQPSLQIRIDTYLKKICDDKLLQKDTKLQARLGLSPKGSANAFSPKNNEKRNRYGKEQVLSNGSIQNEPSIDDQFDVLSGPSLNNLNTDSIQIMTAESSIRNINKRDILQNQQSARQNVSQENTFRMTTGYHTSKAQSSHFRFRKFRNLDYAQELKKDKHDHDNKAYNKSSQRIRSRKEAKNIDLNETVKMSKDQSAQLQKNDNSHALNSSNSHIQNKTQKSDQQGIIKLTKKPSDHEIQKQNLNVTKSPSRKHKPTHRAGVSSSQNLTVEQRVMQIIRKFHVYASSNYAQLTDPIPLKPNVEKVFKQIYSHGEEKENVWESQAHNLTVQKKEVRGYLMKRYNSTITGKIIALFDWSNQSHYYKSFFQNIDKALMSAGAGAPQQDIQSHTISLKQMAFYLYDMNGDGMLDEYDLFSFIKNSDKKLFIDSFNQDFKDIRKKMSAKSSGPDPTHYPKMDEIDDLTKWLESQKFQRNVKKKIGFAFLSDKIPELRDAAEETQVRKVKPIQSESSAPISPNSRRNQETKSLQQMAAKPINPQVQNMQEQGQIQAQEGKNVGLSNLISRSDSMHQRKDLKKIKLEEFVCDIEWKYGLPMIILDVIQALTSFNVVEVIKKELEPPHNIDRMNAEDETFLTLKNNIMEEHQDGIYAIFNELGELNLTQIHLEMNQREMAKRNSSLGHEDSSIFTPQKEMAMKDKETFQYISFTSIKQNMSKLFKTQHDPLAEMIFRYMTDCRGLEDELYSLRVNYHTFLHKFEVLWPKKPEPKKSQDESTQAMEEFMRNQTLNNALDKMAFSLLDLDGDGVISTMDLNWLYSNFEFTKLGKQINQLFEFYMEKNVRPKNLKVKLLLDQAVFQNLVPECHIINDLQYVFCQKLIDDLEAKENNDKDGMFGFNDTMQSNKPGKPDSRRTAFINRKGPIKVNESSSSDEEEEDKYKFSFVFSEKIKEHQKQKKNIFRNAQFCRAAYKEALTIKQNMNSKVNENDVKLSKTNNENI